MKISYFALLVGLFLGTVLAFGTFGQFLLVTLFGVAGLAIGLILEGRIEIRGANNLWKG